MLKNGLKRLLFNASERFGVRFITRNSPAWDETPVNAETEFLEIYRKCRPYTMTSPGAMYGLFKAMQYIVKSGIPGDIAECGVYRGGSIMVCAQTLLLMGDRTRKLYLYDTFEGMTEPGERDVDFRARTPQQHARVWGVGSVGEMARAGLDEVKRNVALSGYPPEQLIFVKGKVEETIPATVPSRLALLRLDTDWYASTRHELIHLFPVLSPQGVLIVDDYSMWQGARQAVDEYFTTHGVNMLLNRMDRTGEVVGVKPG
jgi:hypothetical protein